MVYFIPYTVSFKARVRLEFPVVQEWRRCCRPKPENRNEGNQFTAKKMEAGTVVA